MKVRASAALTLASLIKGEASLQSLFDKALEKVQERDRGLYHELVYGVLRHYELLLELQSALLEKKLKNKDSDILALILLGIYQIKFMRVPDHAAISETVSATKALKKNWAKALVNASLRNFIRKQGELEEKAAKAPQASACLPQWLLSEIQTDWPEHWQSIVSANQSKPPVTLRNNPRRQSREQLETTLKEAGILTQPNQWADQGLSLKLSADINKVEALSTGAANVQDEAAQLSAKLLQLEPNQRVLDACAAPGGKSSHILETEHSVALTALESDAERAELMQQNFIRGGLDPKVIVCDAADLDHWWDGQTFDRVLLDAPCSAVGVIRRHPDIKLLRRENDLAKLVEIQSKLLQTLWRCLKPGGILVYATCSILKRENEAVVADFVSNEQTAEHIDIEANWGEKRPFGRQLLPKIDAHDGFYYAKLIKVRPA